MMEEVENMPNRKKYVTIDFNECSLEEFKMLYGESLQIEHTREGDKYYYEVEEEHDRACIDYENS